MLSCPDCSNLTFIQFFMLCISLTEMIFWNQKKQGFHFILGFKAFPCQKIKYWYLKSAIPFGTQFFYDYCGLFHTKWQFPRLYINQNAQIFKIIHYFYPPLILSKFHFIFKFWFDIDPPPLIGQCLQNIFLFFLTSPLRTF